MAGDDSSAPSMVTVSVAVSWLLVAVAAVSVSVPAELVDRDLRVDVGRVRDPAWQR